MGSLILKIAESFRRLGWKRQIISLGGSMLMMVFIFQNCSRITFKGESYDLSSSNLLGDLGVQCLDGSLTTSGNCPKEWPRLHPQEPLPPGACVLPVTQFLIEQDPAKEWTFFSVNSGTPKECSQKKQKTLCQKGDGTDTAISTFLPPLIVGEESHQLNPLVECILKCPHPIPGQISLEQKARWSYFSRNQGTPQECAQSEKQFVCGPRGEMVPALPENFTDLIRTGMVFSECQITSSASKGPGGGASSSPINGGSSPSSATNSRTSTPTACAATPQHLWTDPNTGVTCLYSLPETKMGQTVTTPSKVSEGVSIATEAVFQCQSDGTWSGALTGKCYGLCYQITEFWGPNRLCQNDFGPTTAINTSMTRKPSGYPQLLGEATFTCNERGKWVINNSAPIICEPRSSAFIHQGNGKGNGKVVSLTPNLDTPEYPAVTPSLDCTVRYDNSKGFLVEGRCMAYFDRQTTLKLTATPNEDSFFAAWSTGGYCGGSTNPECSLFLQYDRNNSFFPIFCLKGQSYGATKGCY